MYKFISFFILIAFVTTCFAQTNKVQKDTSFTLNATFIKEQKKRPFITIAITKPKSDVLIQKDIEFRKIGERSLSLDIYYPKRIHKLKPAVLLIFGGGWRSGDKSQNEAMSTELANKGFVAVSAEYRLSGEAQYPAAVYDLKAAIKWMKINATTYGIDTNRISALGVSAGGQLAALIGTTNNIPQFEDTIGFAQYHVTATIHSAIDIDGILAFHHPESAEGVVASQWIGGTYEQRPDRWKEASALEHVSNQTVPFLFINSSLPRFHAGRTDFIKQLDSLHIYSEVHTIEDTPHPFWFFNPWFSPLMDYVDGFLKKVDHE